MAIRPAELGPFYSINQAAKILGVSRRTVERMLERGELGVTKIGGQYRIPASEVDELVRRNYRPATNDER